MNTVRATRRDVDKKRVATGADAADPNVPRGELLVIDDETDEPVLAVGRFPAEHLAEYRRAVMAYPKKTVTRLVGTRNASTTFGFLGPSSLMQRPSCRACGSAAEAPEAHATICDAARLLTAGLVALVDGKAEADLETTAAAVHADWLLDGSAWTSGVVNYNSPMPFHFDANNLPTWSAMVVLRRGVRGGHLVVPEYDLVLPCRDGDVVYFAGWEHMHAVTPLRIVDPDGYRYSSVYYSVARMKHCGPADEQLAHSRASRTRAEDDWRARQSAQGLLAVESIAYNARLDFTAEPTDERPEQAPLILTGSRQRLSLPLLRWCPRPTVLVEPQELDAYVEAHPDVDVQPLLENDRGFAYLLNAMVQQTLSYGHDFFVFTDDDVTDLKARPSIESKFGPCRGAAAEQTLASLIDLARGHGLAQLAVSFSGQSWGAKKAYQEPAGSWGVHITNAAAVRKVGGYDEALPIFNDWEMSARLLAAGYRCGRTNLVTFVHKMKAMAGGAADLYARSELVAAAAAAVAARYPGEARVEHVEAHGLDEVRFNWRKIAARGAQETPGP